MSAKEGTFVWYELMTSDDAAARDFYAQAVGWQTIPPASEERPFPRFAIGDAPVAGVVPICGEMESAGVRPIWMGYIAVDDAADFMARLQGLGGKVLRDPTDVEGLGTYGVVADPQGAVFNFIEKPVAVSQEGVARNTPGLVCWRELRAKNASTALEFYGSLFGWKQVGAHDMGPLGTYHLIGQGEEAFGAIFTLDVEDIPAHWYYYFFVEAMDAAVERVTGAGGKVYREPREIPGPSWTAQFIDPQSAGFALVAMTR